MPVKSKKQTAGQLDYNRKRSKQRECIDKQIQKEYLKMRLKKWEKGYIISQLQSKFRNSDGAPYSHTRIYQAIDIRKTNKELRAMQGCNP